MFTQYRMVRAPCLILLSMSLHAVCASAQCMYPLEGHDKEMLCPVTGRRLEGKAPQNDTLEMYVRPAFEMWTGLNFAGGFAEGIFVAEQIWPSSADTYFSATDASAIVRLSNFNGGNSGLVSQPIIKLESPGSQPLYEVRRQFEGRFKQSFDATCYPYDHQEVKFEIAMDAPVNLYWAMYLVCNDGESAKDSQGNVLQAAPRGGLSTNIYSCTKTLGTTSVGLEWDELVCTRTSPSAITCSMQGTRANGRIISNFLLPLIMVTMMSFASFMLHVSHAMPRVATTMIAMLTLINLRNALVQGLPGSGNMSWMEKYFMFSVVFMFLNLCCHIAAMGLHKKDFPLLSDFVDDLGCGVSFCLSVIIPFILLISSGCTEEAISEELAVIIIVFGFLLLFAVIIKAFYTKKDAIRAWKDRDRKIAGSDDRDAVVMIKPSAEGP